MDINYINMYMSWLNENIEQHKIKDDIFRITLPFMDRNNDFIDIYIIDNKNQSYTLTDDGATLNDLQISGFEIKGQKRNDIFHSVISSYGVSLSDNNELIINCSYNDLPLKKHMLAQCMIKVSDMFFLSKNNVQSIFLEDVQLYLDNNNIRYMDNISIVGKSKLISHYDFGIAKSNEASERFIKVINNFDINAARNIIFSWNDIKEERHHDTQLYAFIYDTDKKISSDALDALREYDIKPALWSNKNNYIKELIA